MTEDDVLDGFAQELFFEMYDDHGEPRLKSTPHPRDYANAYDYAEALDDHLDDKWRTAINVRQGRRVLLRRDGMHHDPVSLNLFVRWHGREDILR